MTMTRRLGVLPDGSHDREAFRYGYTLLGVRGVIGERRRYVNKQIRDKDKDTTMKRNLNCTQSPSLQKTNRTKSIPYEQRAYSHKQYPQSV